MVPPKGMPQEVCCHTMQHVASCWQGRLTSPAVGQVQLSTQWLSCSMHGLPKPKSFQAAPYHHCLPCTTDQMHDARNNQLKYYTQGVCKETDCIACQAAHIMLWCWAAHTALKSRAANAPQQARQLQVLKHNTQTHAVHTHPNMHTPARTDGGQSALPIKVYVFAPKLAEITEPVQQLACR